jgi:hypothetical protein
METIMSTILTQDCLVGRIMSTLGRVKPWSLSSKSSLPSVLAILALFLTTLSRVLAGVSSAASAWPDGYVLEDVVESMETGHAPDPLGACDRPVAVEDVLVVEEQGRYCLLNGIELGMLRGHGLLQLLFKLDVRDA